MRLLLEERLFLLHDLDLRHRASLVQKRPLSSDCSRLAVYRVIVALGFLSLGADLGSELFQTSRHASHCGGGDHRV